MAMKVGGTHPTGMLSCFVFFIHLICVYLSYLTRCQQNKLQECIPVGCVPPALYRTGGLPDRDPSPWTETPPGQKPPRTNPLPRTDTPL